MYVTMVNKKKNNINIRLQQKNDNALHNAKYVRKNYSTLCFTFTILRTFLTIKICEYKPNKKILTLLK